MKIRFTLLLATGLLISACAKKTPIPPAEQISGKEWRISRAFINGSFDNNPNYNGFRIRFTFHGNNGGTYSLTPALAPAKPNLTSSNSGTWVMDESNTIMTLDRGTSAEVLINLVSVPTESSLSIEWRVPTDIDKTAPARRYDLISQ